MLRSTFAALGAALTLFTGQALAVSGNIQPASIEIDKSANLTYPGPGVVLNAGATADWIKDSLANTDAGSVNNSIAPGIIPGVTGAVQTGHWNGVRIVDGIGNTDQDIFLTGGKENDLSTWNVGPGSVGSAKYDITQAYLANNQTSLFFGMERRGNDGTTAFDFEFNQKAPASPTVPTRTVGDVLFTFEMQGSGNSGSATPFYYKWNGTAYVLQAKPSSLISSINATDTPAAPWGYVDSKGDWTTGNLPRFEFAEAAVNLAQAFPNFSPCNTRLFVQVRTRSSSTATSDLKDTTRIFEYLFGGPTAKSSLTTNCEGQVIYDGSGSRNVTGGADGLSYAWDFTVPAGTVLTGQVTGPDANGVYHSTSITGAFVVSSFPAGATSAVITAKLTVTEGSLCVNAAAPVAITVYKPLAATISKASQSGSALSVTLTASAPAVGTLAYQWQRKDASGAFVNISGATSASYTFTGFEANDPNGPTVQNFNIDGTTYAGKVYAVDLRVKVTRTTGSLVCEAVSAPKTVKKVIAVDP
jgi:hypothetical protein